MGKGARTPTVIYMPSFGNLERKMTDRAGDFMAALLLLQPLLDVLSYFMRGAGATAITTALRLALLVAVSLYGFAITERRDLYAAAYAVMGGFWLLHVLSCLRGGYQDPIGDAAEYLKLIQLPLWTMSFVTIFRSRDGLDLQLTEAIFVNLAIILLVIGLSYLTGHTAYTYEFPERNVRLGMLGWFGVANAQSAILSIIAPCILLWGLRSEKLWCFCQAAFMSLGLLYFTGTRLTFYTALLTAIAFLILIPLCRKPLIFCAPMVAAIILLLVFRGASPMMERQEITSTSFSTYQEKIDSVMGEDKDFVYHKGEEVPAGVKKKIETLYTEVYGGKGVYGEVLMGELLNEFGAERVMEKFEYSISPSVLNNSRVRKLKALEMVWEDEDFLTHLLGLEYSDAVIGGHNYDPENDFPALLYYTGYLGTGLYFAFLLGLIGYAVLAFFRRFPALLSTEFAAALMMCAIGLGAAQLSGQVLRRPNVTVYISFGLAWLYVQAKEARPATYLRPGHKRNPAVSIKKLEP